MNDERARRRCLTRELCGLCGQPLDPGLVVLIGGPRSVETRYFLDAPMHKDCALYAAQVCPYLSDPNWDHADRPPRHAGEEGVVLLHQEFAMNRRPDRIAVYYCRSYEMELYQGQWLVKAGKPFRVDWDACARRGQ